MAVSSSPGFGHFEPAGRSTGGTDHPAGNLCNSNRVDMNGCQMRDVRAWERRNVGTWERGNVRTSERVDVGTSKRGNVIMLMAIRSSLFKTPPDRV